MKGRSNIRIGILAGILLVVMFFNSCSATFREPDSSSNQNNETDLETNESKNPSSNGGISVVDSDKDYFFKAHSSIPELKDAFTDGVYNYYYYYLGYLENFPLTYSTSKYYDQSSGTITFSETISAESQQSVETAVSNSVTESNANSTSFEKGIEISIGTETSVLNGKGYINVIDDWSWEHSKTHEITYAVANAQVEGTSTTYTQEFNSNDKAGFYRYVKYAKKCDVFVLIAYDVEEQTFSWKYLSYTDGSNQNLVEMIEYSPDGDFESNHSTTLNFDIKLIESIDVNQALTDKSPSQPPVVVPIKLAVNKHLCENDKAYDMSTSGNATDGENDHSLYEIGGLTIYGCIKQGNLYHIEDEEQFKIEYIFEENPNDLPCKKDGDLRISSDDETSVLGSDIQGNKIGKGAYCINIVYKNGSSEAPIIVFDFMNNKSDGSVVDLLTSFSLDLSEIAQIKITIVYELYYWASIFDHHYTNWRSEYILNFN